MKINHKSIGLLSVLLLLNAFAQAQGKVFGPYTSNAAIRSSVASTQSADKPSSNTFLMGILHGKYGVYFREPIKLKIYRGPKLLAGPLEVRGGLFSVDLQGLAEPDDVITIVVPAQRSGQLIFSEKRVKVALAQGQNLDFDVDYCYIVKRRGIFQRRCRYYKNYYINEI